MIECVAFVFSAFLCAVSRLQTVRNFIDSHDGVRPNVSDGGQQIGHISPPVSRSVIIQHVVGASQNGHAVGAGSVDAIFVRLQCCLYLLNFATREREAVIVFGVLWQTLCKRVADDDCLSD